MSAIIIEQLYHQYIESIPVADQLQLIALMSHQLAKHAVEYKSPKTRSLLELEGLGAEIWEGVDVQEYINELRDKWEAQT